MISTHSNTLIHGIAKVAGEPNGLALVEKQIREPEEGEVRLRVLAAGICGTDLEIYRWPAWVSSRMRLPTILGHEGCGIVEAIGPGVSHVEEGDVVALESHIHCGNCHNCLTGKTHVCMSLRYLGVDIDGVFANSTVVPARIAFPVPPEISTEVATLLEPFGLAVRTAMTGDGVSGKDVLITGAGGPIGVMTAIAAKRLGASQVIAADVADYRLKFVRKRTKRLGIDRVTDSSKEDLGTVTCEMTGGKGADVWIDFSGVEAALHDGLQAIVPGGEACFLGSAFEPVPIDTTGFMMKEVSVRFIHGRLMYQTWVDSIRLMKAAQEELKLLITHVLPLEKFEEAFDLLFSGDAVKLVLRPNGSYKGNLAGAESMERT